MKPLISYTRPEFFKRLDATDKMDAIRELAEVFQDRNICSDSDDLQNALLEREAIMSTGIGLALAVPHAKIPGVKQLAFAVGLSKDGIDFEAMDGEWVRLIIMVVAGESQHKDYLKLLSRLIGVLRDPETRQELLNVESSVELYARFAHHSGKL